MALLPVDLPPDPLSFIGGIGDPGHTDELLDTFAGYAQHCAAGADNDAAVRYAAISAALRQAQDALRELVQLELAYAES